MFILDVSNQHFPSDTSSNIQNHRALTDNQINEDYINQVGSIGKTLNIF